MMRLKNFAHGALVCVAAIVCRTSSASSFGAADTLSLQGTGGQVVGGVYVYPYDMSFNSSSTTAPMMCINYNDEITQGEIWQITGQQVSTSSSVQIKEDAWIFSQLGNYSDSDVQYAVWDVLDPGDVNGNPNFDSVSQHLVTMAQNAVPGLSNSFLNQYTILTPVQTQQAMATWTDGLPQSFIAESSAVTPEPASLLLLGTGLSGLSVLLMRRRALQEQASKDVS